MATIGPIPLPPPGQKRSGYFTFGEEPQLARYRWPFFSLVGPQPGPTFLVTAGIHAAEYTGIEAAIRLGRRIAPVEVRGTLVVLPLLNRPGFYARSIYVNPEDHDNINRVFPGEPGGSWSHRFAYHLLNAIVARCEHLVDLHAGDLVEDLVPFCIYRETGDPALDAKARRMAEAYGAPWLVRAMPTGERPGTLYAQAAARGVAAMIAESGRCGLLEEEAVVLHVDGVENILRACGALDGAPRHVEPPRLLDRFEWLRSPHEGLFHCRVNVDARVRAGQVLGEMIDLLGNHLGDVVAPADGVVLFRLTSPAIEREGLLLGIGVPAA